MSTRRKVSAVVLAGGFGTRLSPVTDTKPKPLVTVLDKTVLENVVSAVKKTEVSDIAVSCFYKAEMIERMCAQWDGNIVCKRESIPLGTAGAVKYCCDGEYDAVLVVSGDAVFDFSLQEAIDFHFESANDVTIVTSRKENPTEYGVVICDDENNIIRFDEKPAWKNVRSDLVNTGIYVLSKSVLSEIPQRTEYDFSKNLFPKLMREGKRIKAFCTESFWCDIGTLDEYYICNALAAKNEVLSIKNDGKETVNLVREGIHAQGDVYVSKSAVVGKNVRIGSGSILCENSHVADDCDIALSIIGKGTRIGKGSIVNGAILCENISVGENCIIPDGVVIGGNCRIADGTVIKKNTRIKAHETVFGKGVDDMDFSKNTHIFVDDGKVVFDGGNMYSDLVFFSRAVSIAFRKSNDRHISVCVMCDKNSMNLKNAVMSGFMDEKDLIFDCGDGNVSLLSFGVKKLDADAGILVTCENKKTVVTVLSNDGKTIDDTAERKISKIYGALCDGVQDETDSGKNFDVVKVPISFFYTNSLLKYSEKLLGQTDLSGVEVSMSRKMIGENECFKALEEVLLKKSCKIYGAGDKAILNISMSDDGTRANVRKSTLLLDSEHINAVILKNAYIFDSCDISADENIPAVLKGLVKDSNKNDNIFCVTTDAASSLLAFLCTLKMRGETIENLVREIPRFEIFTDEYIADVNRGATMERLSKLYSNSKKKDGDGIHLSLAEGNVTVIPNRARGFKIISEAQNMEAAKELCFKIGKAIKNEEL